METNDSMPTSRYVRPPDLAGPVEDVVNAVLLADPDHERKAAFLRSMEKLVVGERAATEQRVFRIWSKPIPERVASGYAIEGVEISRSADSGMIRLAFARNQSRFREGDILCLNKGDPRSHPSMMVTLDEDHETELLVSLYEMDAPWGDLWTDQTDWVLDEGFVDLSTYFLDVLHQVGESSIGRERILPILMGLIKPVIETSKMERGLAYGDEAGLNWSQCEALAHAYASDSVYLGQGPPGTGKTRVLGHLAEILVGEGERVLVTALTHRAINNALNVLDKVAPLTPAVKSGHPNRTEDLNIDCFGDFGSSPMADMSGGYVIGATPFAGRTKRLSGVEFDTIIFDEASQITMPMAVMAMLSGKKYVFIGDHKQLPPVLASDPPGDASQHSVF